MNGSAAHCLCPVSAGIHSARHVLALETIALRQQLALQTNTAETEVTNHRSDLLDHNSAAMVRLGRRADFGQPETVVSWHRAGFRLFWRVRSSIRGLGRPKISAEIRTLIRRMRAENPRWGAPRVHGELLKLGFQISEPTVSRYLRGLKRRPDVGKAQRWLAFVSNHREVLAALDFLTVPTLTFRVLYCRILPFHASAHPTSDWVLQQLREAFPLPTPFRYVVLNRDSKYSQEVLEFLRSNLPGAGQPGLTWRGTLAKEAMERRQQAAEVGRTSSGVI